MLIVFASVPGKRKELYQKILSMIPADMTVISIIEKELDNFKR